MNEALRHYTNEFRSRRDVAPHHAQVVFDALIAERDEVVVSDLLGAWADKGATEDELYRFASIMRSRMKPLDTRRAGCVDIVGTGGSNVKTFNVSTAAAFVVAGAGVPVAKHGNRAATSKSGSADVLAKLGVRHDVEPSVAENCLGEIGICFMFAPKFHTLSATIASARKRLGRPTIFNNLGPLCNPANVQHQLMGISNCALLEKTARVMQLLGTRHSWIVHSESGLDEIALYGETRVAELINGSIETFTITATDFGIECVANDLPSNCTATESSNLIREILRSKRRGDDAEKLVLVNAAAAIFVAGIASDLRGAYSVAEESIRSGAAMEKLMNLVEMTNQ